MTVNDEPVYQDALGHYDLVKRVGHRLLTCSPPYVVGVCGSWGAGKTSFLKMLWAYLGGAFDMPEGKRASLNDKKRGEQRREWFGESQDDFKTLVGKRNLELIWFNPWQHQFESSPLVALLHEIRQHFSLARKFFNEAGKLADVSTYATLNALMEFGKNIIPTPNVKGILERGREYEAETFSSALTSQRFRDFFEGAISKITGKDGLLVIFIDDLDRCEGEVAYRMLEALKLYLNAHNAVYVIGLDQQHLESSIAKALSGEKDTWRYRPLARDYLSKIFQIYFPLPVPRHTEEYVEQLLDASDQRFKIRLARLFGFKGEDWSDLVAAIDENLPHNPRKIKSFISSWKLYLDSLPIPAGEKLDWRLTVILHYLAQFEEPLFRKVEQSPDFYPDHILPFCLRGLNRHYLFDDLELPYEILKSALASDERGGLTPPPGKPQEDESTTHPQSRVFWISRLVTQLAQDEAALKISDETIHRHLVQTGGKFIPPPPAQESKQ